MMASLLHISLERQGVHRPPHSSLTLCPLLRLRSLSPLFSLAVLCVCVCVCVCMCCVSGTLIQFSHPLDLFCVQHHAPENVDLRWAVCNGMTWDTSNL
jgi:hypothetical protein